MVVVTSTSSFSAPVEGIILAQPSSKLFVNDHELGTATLYITESNVVWGGGISSTGGTAPTISLQYRDISLHAIQRDPTPSLYMVVNYEIRLPELGNIDEGHGDANDDDFDVNDTPITQLRFIPLDHNDIQTMYTAMCHGQSLHPDAQDEHDEEAYLDGEDFEEDEFEDAEELNPTPEDAASRLRNLRLNTNGTQTQNGEANDSEDLDED